MKGVTRCIVCGSLELAGTPAVVALFIRHYALMADRNDTHAPTQAVLLTCASCDMTFYDLRFDDGEIRTLYKDYRGERYYKTRHRFEPFYTRKLNGMGHAPIAIDTRKREVEVFISDALGEGAIRSVLDFGGDAGQFIPEFQGAERYVLEVSDVKPVPGVTSVDELADLKRPVDLIMVAHVLEHLSDPVALLQELTSASSEGGHLYVEVPMDRPKMPPPWAARLQASWVDAVARSPRRTAIADAISTPVRVLARKHWIPFTFPRLHEHINFFSSVALERAAERSGWEVVGQIQYVHRWGLFALPVLGILAVRKGPEPNVQ